MDIALLRAWWARSIGGAAPYLTHVDPAALSIVKAGDFKASGVYRQ